MKGIRHGGDHEEGEKATVKESPKKEEWRMIDGQPRQVPRRARASPTE